MSLRSGIYKDRQGRQRYIYRVNMYISKVFALIDSHGEAGCLEDTRKVMEHTFHVDMQHKKGVLLKIA